MAVVAVEPQCHHALKGAIATHELQIAEAHIAHILDIDDTGAVTVRVELGRVVRILRLKDDIVFLR